MMAFTDAIRKVLNKELMALEGEKFNKIQKILTELISYYEGEINKLNSECDQLSYWVSDLIENK